MKSNILKVNRSISVKGKMCDLKSSSGRDCIHAYIVDAEIGTLMLD